MRQTERRERFNQLFPTMPLWETWQEQRPSPTADDPLMTLTRFVSLDTAKEFQDELDVTWHGNGQSGNIELLMGLLDWSLF